MSAERRYSWGPGAPADQGRDYTPEEVAFLRACDQYRRANDLRFLSLTATLAVALALGYRRVAEPADWCRPITEGE